MKDKLFDECMEDRKQFNKKIFDFENQINNDIKKIFDKYDKIEFCSEYYKKYYDNIINTCKNTTSANEKKLKKK